MKKIMVTLGFACFACAIVFGSATAKSNQAANLIKSNIEAQTANAGCACECSGDFTCSICTGPCSRGVQVLW